jgi:type II secretory pathway pseudopilin PulG
MPPVQPHPEHASIGGIIATIIIISLIVLGGLYFWGKRIDTQKQMLQQQNAVDQQALVDEARSIQKVSASTDTTTLEGEIQTTDIDNIDAEIR